jgi:hypothetical protein
VIANALSIPSDLAQCTEAELEGRLSDVTAIFTNNVTGDVTVSGGTSALGDDVVAAAEMADADHGDIRWGSGVAYYDTSGVMDIHRDSVIHTYKFAIPDPNSYFDVDSLFCFEPVTAKAITITRIDITCDADPATEPAMSLRFADNFISRTTPTTIDVVTTAVGVTTITTGFDDATVPASNCMYLAFTADPIAAINSITFKVSYTVD